MDSNLEILVVLFQHPDCQSLYAELPHSVDLALPVRRAGDAYNVLRLELPYLQQDDGEVVYEQQGVY